MTCNIYSTIFVEYWQRRREARAHRGITQVNVTDGYPFLVRIESRAVGRSKNLNASPRETTLCIQTGIKYSKIQIFKLLFK